MVKCNSFETRNIYQNLNDEQQLKLSKNNEVKDYYTIN